MFLAYLLLWFLFNSRITLEIFLFGLVIAAACYGLTCFLFGFSIRKDLELFRKLPGMLRLLGTLLVEIVKANLSVIRAVYSPVPTEPRFVIFTVPLRATSARVALADCITLTPGTITGLLEGDRYTVHCLDGSMAKGIEESVFVRQLAALSGAALTGTAGPDASSGEHTSNGTVGAGAFSGTSALIAFAGTAAVSASAKEENV